VVEVAEELVEAVSGGQERVAVAEVILARLPGGIAERLQNFGDCGVLRLQAEIGAGQANLGQSGAKRALPGQKSGAAGGAALLGVVVSEQRPLARDPVDVGRSVAEYAYDRQSHIGRLDRALDEAKTKGWTVADMKTDWRTVFPVPR
jgi:hypothetical protein